MVVYVIRIVFVHESQHRANGLLRPSTARHRTRSTPFPLVHPVVAHSIRGDGVGRGRCGSEAQGTATVRRQLHQGQQVPASISQSPGARLRQHTGRALRAPCWHRLGHRRPEERTSALTTHSAAVAEALLLHSGHRTHPHRGRLVPGDHRQPAPDRTLVADLAPGLPRPSEAVRPTSRSARAFPWFSLSRCGYRRPYRTARVGSSQQRRLSVTIQLTVLARPAQGERRHRGSAGRPDQCQRLPRIPRRLEVGPQAVEANRGTIQVPCTPTQPGQYNLPVD